jgi:hypothetical protein
MTTEKALRRTWKHRLVVYPSASGDGIFVALERYVDVGVGWVWIYLTGFTIPNMSITSRDLWEQAWIHTGFFGEKVPE